jgi:hypothetical protein
VAACSLAITWHRSRQRSRVGVLQWSAGNLGTGAQPTRGMHRKNDAREPQSKGRADHHGTFGQLCTRKACTGESRRVIASGMLWCDNPCWGDEAKVQGARCEARGLRCVVVRCVAVQCAALVDLTLCRSIEVEVESKLEG